MTISNPTNLATLTGNGVTTSFPYTFLIPDEDSVEVTLLTIATGAETDPLASNLYTISGIGDPAGGEVEYPLVGSPLAATHKINIRRVVPYEQGLSLTAQSGYDPEALEDQLDLIVMQVQQVAEEVSRAVLTTAGSGIDPDDLIDDLLEAETNATAAAAAALAAQVAAEAAQAAAEAAAALAGTGSVTYYKWTATAGQTAFTGATATPVLSNAPAGKSACIVNVNGRPLLQEEFTLAGVDFTLTFNDIEVGEIVEVGVFTSDVLNTVSNGAITTVKLDVNAVTNAKLAQMAESTIKGRATGAGTGDPTDLTATQVLEVLSLQNGVAADNLFLHGKCGGL